MLDAKWRTGANTFVIRIAHRFLRGAPRGKGKCLHATMYSDGRLIAESRIFSRYVVRGFPSFSSERTEIEILFRRNREKVALMTGRESKPPSRFSPSNR